MMSLLGLLLAGVAAGAGVTIAASGATTSADNDDLGFDLLFSGVGGDEVNRQTLVVEGA